MASRKREIERLCAVLELLTREGPRVRPNLNHRTPWELLVATVLSAQCTDTRVNQVTPLLFSRYPSPEALAGALIGELEETIRSIGIFRNKARNLMGLARKIIDEYGGEVPKDRARLEALPGVGRKTASVVLGQAFGIPAFPVDTHVARVCHRLGFSPTAHPLEVETRVTAILDPESWITAHLLLIRHGRLVCTARSPKCPRCLLRHLCPWPRKV